MRSDARYDLRHPLRSLRVVAAELRGAGAIEVRVRAFGIPLYGPPAQWGGSARLSGGGVSYGPGLLSPARPSATVDGAPRPGRLLDLGPEGLGWLAEVDLSEGYRLDLAADGFEPDGLSLVSRAL